MEAKDRAAPVSRLLQLTSIEPRDELDEKLERCYNIVQGMMAGTERENQEGLQAHIAKGNQQHDEVQMGLLYSVLSDPKGQAKSFREMVLVARDGLTCLLTKVNQIVYEKWLKLMDQTKSQMIWLCRELAKMNATGADSVCLGLLRQIVGGDISQKNVWLAESMLDLFVEHKEFLAKNSPLLTTVVYTYLRVIIDHSTPQLARLRQRETHLVVQLLRTHWNECIGIGRDLVRLLQNVARIPDFMALWNDIVFNPSVLSPTFTGVAQLMAKRTPRRFLAGRVTPDMETKLMFLITKVKFGNHKRYQDWFQKQYLMTPESQSLRCDLIRYICAVFHPSNELLCSDIIPRWAVIGWLLTTCTSNVVASDAKLALFYDWLFFDLEKDSIMNIEPAALVMFHSMRPHKQITATLLDFMCRIMKNFSLHHTTQIKTSMHTALRDIRDKRVLASLSPLFDNPIWDKELRVLLRDSFPEFCTVELPKEEVPVKGSIDLETQNHLDNNCLSDGAVFSDDEDEGVPIAKIKEELGSFRPIKESSAYQPVDITDHVGQLTGDIHELTVELQSESNQEMQCHLTDQLMQKVIQDEEFDGDLAATLAICLCEILSSQFHSALFPDIVDDESIEDSIGSPLFVIFRFLSQMSDEDPRRSPLLQLLAEMHSKQPRVGYMLLYFLKVSKGSDEKMSTYKDFCHTQEGKDLKSCLVGDLKTCQVDDVRLFTFLIPDIYTHFSNLAVGNASIVNLIVSCIDGTQLQDLICQILQGHLQMFNNKSKDSFLSVLNSSLEWETIEQYFLWQLIMAHDIPVEHMLPLLPRLDYAAHAEALTSLMVLLKQTSPSWDLLRPVLCRDCKKSDFFTVSVLKYWACSDQDALAQLIHTQLTRSQQGGTPKKRQRGGGSKKDQPSVDQILAHLDHMRQVCRNISFLNHEDVQHALQQVQLSATDSQKNKYSDLLALAEEIDDMKPVRLLRGGRRQGHGGHSPKPRGKPKADSESDAVDSSDDEIKHHAKKKKKIAVDEDSD